MDKECLEFLISKKLFEDTNYKNYVEFIAIKEILMSQLILKNNWNISCIIPEYQNIDYTIEGLPKGEYEACHFLHCNFSNLDI